MSHISTFFLQVPVDDVSSVYGSDVKSITVGVCIVLLYLLCRFCKTRFLAANRQLTFFLLAGVSIGDGGQLEHDILWWHFDVQGDPSLWEEHLALTYALVIVAADFKPVEWI